MNFSIIDNKLRIDLDWYEQLWAFTWDKTFEIPLTHIENATTNEPPSSWTEIRAPGTFLPGVIKAGTYYTPRGKEFWYVTKDRDYLVLELCDESFKKMIFTLDQNQWWLEQILQAKTVLQNEP
ncbi:MAG TPA: hypothetical protein DCL61_00215 [Cyanobacteria bacterium UBA12227]|nr:hypothetical protein [Cyanobacteria bacterium UBA12227]HAX89239.1 hypothetical protein [Cyanobacteria bacterium UBA11370]HBY76269.1 hypothetical protein [Cyanobacteria bacterium UBA11148]